MDVLKSQNGIGLQTVTDSQARSQEVQNAVNQFQAKYGEKPKEQRAVKKQLDKDDFMRIMITEMKHQDPTKPMDADRMATQMAQVTSVEQMKNVAAAVDRLADKNSATDRIAMSAMIGKTVTVDKGRFVHQKGNLSPINFDLPEDAQKIKLSIQNEKGEEIASRVLEPMKSGPNVYNWDGVNASNTQSASGGYMVRVEAENAKGGKIKVDPISKESIVGVTFEGGETNFLVGDAKNPQKVAFKNVSRIEGDVAPQKLPSQSKIIQGVNEDGKKSDEQNSDLPKVLQDKVKAELMAKANAEKEESPESDSQKGFPNGLQD
jgi:flagellar basal-body rod modification protein FlgD